MKKSRKMLALLLVLCTLVLCACTITYPVDAPDTTEQPTDTDTPVLHGPVLSYISDYTVIYPTRATNGEKDAAMRVMNAIDNSRRPEVDYISNKEEIPHNNREILIGNTNRTASQTAIAALNKDRDFSVSFNKDEVVIAAKTDAALADAVTYFLGTVLTADISHYSVGTVDTQLYSYPLSGFFGLSPDAGPGLTFITMPAVFAQLPFGQFFAIIFYLCIVVAAITSSVSMIEITVAFLVDEHKFTRVTASIASTVALAVVGSLPCLSFGILSDVKFFGTKTIFDIFDFFTSNISLPLGGLVILYLAGWKCWRAVRDEILKTSRISEGQLKLLRLMMIGFSPVLVLIVLISGLI